MMQPEYDPEWVGPEEVAAEAERYFKIAMTGKRRHRNTAWMQAAMLYRLATKMMLPGKRDG